MSVTALRNAVELGKRMKHVHVATADGNGLPHLAGAAQVNLVSDDRIVVEAWFCPATVQNVQENPFIAVVSWDPGTDTGHQILGRVVAVEETAMMDGFSPEIETDVHLPQSERKLIIRVKEVLAFSHSPHSDRVE